jgi:hypothetical protein
MGVERSVRGPGGVLPGQVGPADGEAQRQWRVDFDRASIWDDRFPAARDSGE